MSSGMSPELREGSWDCPRVRGSEWEDVLVREGDLEEKGQNFKYIGNKNAIYFSIWEVMGKRITLKFREEGSSFMLEVFRIF